MASFRADVCSILEMRGPELETALVELVEDTVPSAPFNSLTAPPEPRECAKSHRSSFTTDGEDALAKKKERTDLEVARRASMIDKETRQMRARELAPGTSSSKHEAIERSTTEGAEIDVGTTEGVPTTELRVTGN